MVVGKDDCGGIVLQSLAHHLPGVNRCAVYRTPEQFPVLDDPVTVIQEQAGEHFMRISAQAAGEKAPGIFR